MPEILSIIKELIFSGAALTGAVVAVIGLNSWKSQLKGQSEYDLARRLLISLFKYRDAINGVRHPVMWVNETPLPPEDKAKKMSHEQIHFYGVTEAYQTRFEKVQKERTHLYTDLLEAEAIWGNEMHVKFQVLFDLQHELYIYIQNYFRMINPEGSKDIREAYQKVQAKRRDIMYDTLDDEEDDFKSEFREGVEQIEKYLKPKLKY